MKIWGLRRPRTVLSLLVLHFTEDKPNYPHSSWATWRHTPLLRNKTPSHFPIMGYSYPKIEFSGSYSFSSQPQKEEGKVIEKGLQKLKDEGSKWAGMMYQTDMVRPLRSNVYISLPPLRLEVWVLRCRCCVCVLSGELARRPADVDPVRPCQWLPCQTSAR